MKRFYDDPIYKRWRKEVYTRDKFCCQWPGCLENKKLNAHHIKRWADNPGLRFSLDNGITLCYKHHKMITGLESDYEAVFNKLIYEKKINDRK